MQMVGKLKADGQAVVAFIIHLCITSMPHRCPTSQERVAQLVGKLKARLEPWFGPGGKEAFARGVEAEAERLSHFNFAGEMLQTIG